jgi:hypothetical protein
VFSRKKHQKVRFRLPEEEEEEEKKKTTTNKKKKKLSMKNSLSFDWCNMKFYELKRRKQHSGGEGPPTSPTLTSSSHSSTSSSSSLSPSPTPSSPWKEKEKDLNDSVIVVQETVSPIIKGKKEFVVIVDYWLVNIKLVNCKIYFLFQSKGLYFSVTNNS